jgi:hypothetical protein
MISFEDLVALIKKEHEAYVFHANKARNSTSRQAVEAFAHFEGGCAALTTILKRIGEVK